MIGCCLGEEEKKQKRVNDQIERWLKEDNRKEIEIVVIGKCFQFYHPITFFIL